MLFSSKGNDIKDQFYSPILLEMLDSSQVEYILNSDPTTFLLFFLISGRLFL